MQNKFNQIITIKSIYECPKPKIETTTVVSGDQKIVEKRSAKNIPEKKEFYNKNNEKIKVITFYDNGKKNSENNYENKVLHGEQRKYDNEGKLKNISEYKNGTLNGRTLRYDPKTGHLELEASYLNGELHGVLKKYKNGSLLFETEYVKGKKSGKMISYGETGNIRQITHYKNDMKEGDNLSFNDKTEELLMCVNYVKDKKEGESYIYYPNSEGKKIYEKAFYKNDQYEGFVYKYYPNGKVREVCEYREGKPTAKPVSFKESGKIWEPLGKEAS